MASRPERSAAAMWCPGHCIDIVGGGVGATWLPGGRTQPALSARSTAATGATSELKAATATEMAHTTATRSSTSARAAVAAVPTTATAPGGVNDRLGPTPPSVPLSVT
eukprot:CAMPEP_0206298758 /NCGR_PEP_ID=MMETSP0106_2-20121207/6849_1 /ASSEMBLY_ACC=CAM_ASM_000206 /TAXON_ID=81532 /ORGANISM="Acanthoeca-like sp., Strain 10tr" /LENGTH=107 /DNA_ID=CAMNT_0053729457 /DNA_START=9 /DNA_END=332 /DNA_ORIENTATION=+